MVAATLRYSVYLLYWYRRTKTDAPSESGKRYAFSSSTYSFLLMGTKGVGNSELLSQHT